MIIYDFLYKAYKYYNQRLFENKLPERIVITIERRSNIKGYFSSSRFSDLRENDVLSQITLNPSYFGKGDEKKVLSTLVHEMCHLYMETKGENGANGYHTKKWAAVMNECGLKPTNNGKKDGKETGFKMTHLIVKDGKFDRLTKELLDKGVVFEIRDKESLVKASQSEIKANKYSRCGKRYKYKCNCSQFWGKNGLRVMCQVCKTQFIQEKKE